MTVANPAHVANILAVFNAATPVQFMDGATWYERAQNEAQAIRDEFYNPNRHVALEQVIGMIAATSPQNGWANNLKLVRKLLKNWCEYGILPTITGGYLGLGLRKCDNILLCSWDIDKTLGGKKIVSFYNNMDMPHISDSVTIDGHARNIADYGLNRKGITKAKSMTDNQYDLYAHAYSEAADYLRKSTDGVIDLTASQVQAVTWVVYRSLKVEA